jgi:hypothetical protein
LLSFSQKVLATLPPIWVMPARRVFRRDRANGAGNSSGARDGSNCPAGERIQGIDRHTEIGARWSDEGVQRVGRLLEEGRLRKRHLEFRG